MALDAALELTSLLDPRTREFQDAIRLTPATLANYRTQGKWLPAPHLLYAASEIAHELSLGDARIILEMPPRHGKSEIASVHTPIWFLDKFPHLNVILTTYSADLSTRFGRRVRDTFIDDDGKFLRAHIREDVQRTDVFLTAEGGGMMSVGIGGPITGFGAHLLVIDDYVKNFAEAISPTVNQSTWDWFASTAYTRLEPGGSVIILATRWAADDLIGRILKKEGRLWKRIRFPALAEESDPLNRAPGEPLWPDRYSRERLLRIKALIGDFLFDALYQQAPRKLEDFVTDISQFRYVDSIPRLQDIRWVRSWDLAASKNKGDYTSGSLVGTDGRPGSPFATNYIADIRRGQWAPAKVEENLRKTAEADGVDVPIVLEQEPGSAGKIAAEHLANNVLRGFKVIINPATGSSKLAKANPYLAAVSNGRVTLLKASWNKIHVDEVKDFPNVAHDDTVDSTAQGYNYLHGSKILTPTWGRSSDAPKTIQQPANRMLVRGCTFRV